MHTLMLTRDVIYGSEIDGLGDKTEALNLRAALEDNPLWEFRAYMGEWHRLTVEQCVAKAEALDEIRCLLLSARRALIVAMERVNAACPRQIDGPPRANYADGYPYVTWEVQGQHDLQVIDAFVMVVVQSPRPSDSVLVWRRRPAIEPWSEGDGKDRYALLWRVSARAVWVPLDEVVT